MVSVKGLCYKNENTAQLLTTAQNETPSCVQLFGHESDFFIKAIQSGELDKFDIIDINIGCPMPKVTKNGDGSSLLKTPAQAFRLIEDVAKTGRTVTVKMRTGWDEKSVDAVNFAKGAQNAGAAAITVHGRTTKQLYGGKADWDIIGNVAAALSIPVVGNGDVKNQSEALEKMKNYKTAAVMIGRGALGNPSIFSEKHVRDEQKREKLCQTLLKHIDYMLEYFNEKYTVVNMRKHLGKKVFPDAKFYKEDNVEGVATAAVQIEGGDKNNDWYEWSMQKGRTKDGTNTLRANEHYKLYKEDLLLMKQLNIRAYRFGIEWARIEPKEGEYDSAAVQHYIDELILMKEYGIEPLLTLHHFSSPIWFMNLGGFENKENVRHFIKFTEFAVRNFGQYVKEYITINEPNVYAYMSYADGIFTPGVKSVKRAFKVMSNLACAHILAYNKIHEISRELGFNDVRVSFANHLAVFSPKNKYNPFNRTITKILESLFQTKLTKAVNTGKFSYPLKNTLKVKKGKYYDFNAINYYTRQTVKGFKPGAKEGEKYNDLGWEIYPQGIVTLAEKIYKKYPADIYITENGTCDAKDAFRSKYIYDHLKGLAMSPLPIKKYYYWTFMDNFEWAEGESARFGLVHCDYETQKRTPRDSAYFYKEIIENNGVTEDMHNKYVKTSK
ncbi:glycosyl hydrolase [Holotrichia oblita]|nr:glycosyl hydrolase [Holotrichia oblita]